MAGESQPSSLVGESSRNQNNVGSAAATRSQGLSTVFWRLACKHYSAAATVELQQYINGSATLCRQGQ